MYNIEDDYFDAIMFSVENTNNVKKYEIDLARIKIWKGIRVIALEFCLNFVGV